jgi:tetratricopeptide (TPR) repeat protein
MMTTNKIKILMRSILCVSLLSLTINTFTAPGYTEVDRKIQQNNKINEVLPQNQLSQELAELDRAIQQNPRDAIAYNNRGVLKIETLINRGILMVDRLDDISGALADFNRSILILKGSANELNPSNAVVYTNRANLSRLKRLDLYLGGSSFALDDYDKAIELNPKDALSYELRASYKHSYNIFHNISASTHTRDCSGALADYNKAIELNPGDASIYNSRGNLKHFYSNCQDLPGALADYNKAIELDPENKVAHKYRDLLKENKTTYGRMAFDYQKAARSFFFENNGQNKFRGRKIN